MDIDERPISSDAGCCGYGLMSVLTINDVFMPARICVVCLQVIGRMRPFLPHGPQGASPSLLSDDTRSLALEEEAEEEVEMEANGEVKGDEEENIDAAAHVSCKPGAARADVLDGTLAMPGQVSGPPLSEVRASLHALPELNDIIRACWQQRDLRRPTAAGVHARIQTLLQQQRARAEPKGPGAQPSRLD